MFPGLREQPASALTGCRAPVTRKQLRQLSVTSRLTDEEVPNSAAEVAAALRGRPLRPPAATLKSLIASPSFSDAPSQLLITLRDATDRIDDLVIKSTKRFLDLHAARQAKSRWPPLVRPLRSADL